MIFLKQNRNVIVSIDNQQIIINLVLAATQKSTSKTQSIDTKPNQGASASAAAANPPRVSNAVQVN